HLQRPEDQSGTGALIFLDTNIISETLRRTPDRAVTAWLVRNDAGLALPTVTIAAVAFGTGEIRRDQRAALQGGRPMTAPDGMIAAIVRINGGRLATRNLPDFATTGLELDSPWDF